MKRIIILAGYFLFLASVVSCNKETEHKNIENIETEKQKITKILVSEGVNSKNIKFSDALPKKNALVFNSIEEFQNFLKKQKDISNKKLRSKNFFDDSDFNVNDDEQNQNEKTISFHLQEELYGFMNATLNVSGYCTYETERMRIVKDVVNSYLTGFTFGIDYEHIWTCFIFEW